MHYVVLIIAGNVINQHWSKSTFKLSALHGFWRALAH